MKHKISQVISSCSDCQFKKDLIEKGGNTVFASVCTRDYDDNQDALLLYYGYQDPKHTRIDIPNECKLEDYVENN